MKIQSIREWAESKDLDKSFRKSYYALLAGQYATLSDPVQDEPTRKEADEIAKKGAEKIEWEDLYRMELAIVKLRNIEDLRRQAWCIRNEYKAVASAEEFKDYVESVPPNAKDSDDKLLRADLVRLQEELNWKYTFMWVLEGYRGQMLQRVVWFTLTILAVSIVLISIPAAHRFLSGDGRFNLPFLEFIVVPGIVGGLISTIRRLQTVQMDGNADLDLTHLEQGNTNIYLSPFLGGIFALLLFALIAGKMLAGDLFPKVSFELLAGGVPQEIDHGELAKLMVWSFIAGFAERFVPDRLDYLTRQTSEEKSKTPAAPVPK
jgi:hypothetical protein